MQLIDGRPVFAATDLVGYLACGHLTDLDRWALAGKLKKPKREDPELELIAERGKIHEADYLAELKAQGRSVSDLDAKPGDEEDRGTYLKRQAERTRAAILEGRDVIFQACFFDGTWLGFADFLLRVEKPTPTLDWSYEVADTKLAHKVKASALIQICVYNEMLEAIQGRYPDEMHVALGGKDKETVRYRTADFTAYYRSVKARFLASAGAPLPGPADPGLPPSYPEPVEHCGVCSWVVECKQRWRADDHLSLVAGIASRTRAELTERGTDTRRALATLGLPLVPKLERTRPESLLRVREQARIQVQGEDEDRHVYELLEPATRGDGELDTTKGLLGLPPPRPGDLYLDLEGDPFAGEDGLDYLFGTLEPGQHNEDGAERFHALWSFDRAGKVNATGERLAFEQTIDLIMDRLARDPEIHVYHYASYEPSHMRRLVGRYRTREAEVDQLLRGDRFIDLFQLVRQGLRASVESYSIKRLEPFYGFRREIELKSADTSILEFEKWLGLGGQKGVGDEVLQQIEDYNHDDVVSTWKLHQWLETLRVELAEKRGEELPRREPLSGDASDTVKEELSEEELVIAALSGDLPDEEEVELDQDQQARKLMADLLGWHRRELKPEFWNFFNQMDELDDEERLEAREPIGMLEPIGPVQDEALQYRYRFAPQDYSVGIQAYNTTNGAKVNVTELDPEARELVVEFREEDGVVHPSSIVWQSIVWTRGQQASLRKIGRAIAEDGLDPDGPYRAARDLLLGEPPRIVELERGSNLWQPGDDPTQRARDLVRQMDGSTLAIQGPPGSGKTYAGARMILDLVAMGKKVGVTANSHKVVGNLLDEVYRAAQKHDEFRDREIRLGQKGRERDEDVESRYATSMPRDKGQKALAANELDVLGGTGWLWSSAKLEGAVDVLFVDEAGQFSLANAIAVSQAADSLVLLGDPQQLDQPLKGTHPPGAGGSALAHLLGSEHDVMPRHLGLFMERTWRLHPDICDYTSEVFYEGALEPQSGNERQALHGVDVADGQGIRFVAVDHADVRNTQDSPEEAARIAQIVGDALEGGSTWVDRDGDREPISPEDILVLTPYNAQRLRILDALAARGGPSADVQVGTVDKFQGQQAPISIYSMSTSRPEDAPRGMEFLYSLNRLNVATSRARCLTLVVASPALLEANARSPRQMVLANALCRLGEIAGGATVDQIPEIE